MTTAEINPKYLPEIHAQLAKRNSVGRGMAMMTAEKKIAFENAEKPAKKRLRQDAKPMNKLEVAFFEYLKEEFSSWEGAKIYPQGMTLLLANGLRYTPDFIVIVPIGQGQEFKVDVVRIFAFETKGFMRDDAAAKIKMAASVYPGIQLHLVTKKKGVGGYGWEIEEVLP